MKIYFNADEIFEMAEEIERQGTKFYAKAASLFKEPDIRQMLSGLSAMEIGHEKTFASIRAKIPSDTYKGSDPDELAAAYIRTFTEGKVFNAKKDLSATLTDKTTLKNILNMAIDSEKNSIVFYTGIKRAVPEALGKDILDQIITEEMKHIVMLADKLSTL